MTKDVVLVAEQDALGRVAAVWRYTSEQKFAKPMIVNDLDTFDGARFRFHGASEQEILNHIKGLPAPRDEGGLDLDAMGDSAGRHGFRGAATRAPN